jgi:hypothetical protein
MKAITAYLKGIEPLLKARNLTLLSEDLDSKEAIFIQDLLKEIAELPAIEEGETSERI